MNASEPRIVVTDWTFPDLAIERRAATAAGAVLEGRQCRSEAELIDWVADADAVITQFAKITPAVIRSMKRARVIVRYGIGVDNVHLEAARECGIPVCNVPDYCIAEVADHTLGLMLALTRQIVRHTVPVRAGEWKLSVPLGEMRALRHSTVGVVGFGRIGREVVRRLTGFGCRILVFDPFAGAADVIAAGASAVSWETILASSDVLTLHCPSTAQTRRMLHRETFSRLKPGAILINVARGDLVDPDALAQALESGSLAGAGLDVFDPEPVPSSHPLLQRANVVWTPHIASASPPAVAALRETVMQRAVAAVGGEALASVVNGVDRPRV